MKILFLPKYPRMGASSRLRTFQYIPLWEKSGHQIKVKPFFNDTYLKQIYAQKKPSALNVLSCYFHRLFIIFTAPSYDLIFIEKELFPYFPSWAEYLLSKLGRGYVADYDDAVFHNYDRHSNSLVRKLMGDKIDKVMRFAKVVFVGNPYLANRAQAAGAKQVVFLPTVIDPNRYHKVSYTQKSVPVIGWIGSPTTMKYLKVLLPLLEKLFIQFPFKLLVINGGGLKLNYKGEIEILPWSEDTEVVAINKMDIGIMPLEESPWEQGKCAYKLIQYMACGLPVVASPIGMNKEVVIHGENGFLAATDQEWIDSLTKLLTNPYLRQSFGQSGYQLVQEKYTLEKNFEILKKVLDL